MLLLLLKGLDEVLSAVLELLLAGQGHITPILIFAHVLFSLHFELPLLDDFQLLCLPLSFSLLLKVPIDPIPLYVLAFINYLIDLLSFALSIYFALLDSLLTFKLEDNFFLTLLILLLLLLLFYLQ